MIRPFFLILFAFVLVFSIPSLSLAKAAKVGDTIPSDLSAKDQTGKMRSFADLKGSKGMTLVFIRSVEWCPFCQKQLLDLNKNAKKFSDAGYPVVSVSYDALPQIKNFVTKNKPTITLLSDPGSEIIRAFGILNTASAKGTMSYGIPHPGVYIVSKNKKIQAKFFTGDYKKRPSVKELLAEIEKLNPPPVLSLDEMGSDPIIPGEDIIEIPEKITDPVVLPDELSDTLEVPDVNTPELPTVEVKVPKVVGGSEGMKLPDMPPPEGLVLPDVPEVSAPEAPAIDMPMGAVPVM